MPKDPKTGKDLPYEGEPGFEEAVAANPEAYMQPETEIPVDFSSRVESLMLDNEEPVAMESPENIPMEQEFSPEEVQQIATRLFSQMYGADAPMDPQIIQMIAAEIAANPSILQDGDIVAALEIFSKMNPQGQTPEEEAVPVV